MRFALHATGVFILTVMEVTQLANDKPTQRHQHNPNPKHNPLFPNSYSASCNA